MTNENGKMLGLGVRDILVLIAAVGSGMGGTIGYQKLNPPRPDPFTGTMARQMEAGIRRDIQRIEHAVDDHLSYSLRKTEFYDSEIASLKERCRKQADR